MKRGLALLGLTLFLLAPMRSQGQAMILVLIFGDDVATENFHFSLDGGLTISELTNLNGKSAVYGNFGLGTHIRINDRWEFAPEFKPLSNRGERKIYQFTDIPDEIADNISSYEQRVKLNYLDIPMLFRYKASQHIYLAAGPQVSFRTSAKVITEIYLENGTEINVVDPIEDQTEWFDVSFPVEIGYNFMQDHKLGGVDIRMRFVPGFLEVATVDGSVLKNNSLQIIASFPFMLSQEQIKERKERKAAKQQRKN